MGDEPSSESQERSSMVDSFNTINRSRDNRAKARSEGKVVRVNSLFDHDKGVTPTDLGHTNLSFKEAFSIAGNPFSSLSSTTEKVKAVGQALVPGGALIGVVRAAAMKNNSTTPAAPSKSGRGANKGGSGGAAARSLYGANPFGSGSSGRTLQNSAPDQVSPFGDDGGNEDLFKLGTNGPAPSAAPKTAASEATSIAKSIAQQQTDAALKKRRQIGGFSLFGSGGSGGSGFLS